MMGRCYRCGRGTNQEAADGRPMCSACKQELEFWVDVFSDAAE